jgi:hypothetical protein
MKSLSSLAAAVRPFQAGSRSRLFFGNFRGKAPFDPELSFKTPENGRSSTGSHAIEPLAYRII